MTAVASEREPTAASQEWGTRSKDLSDLRSKLTVLIGWAAMGEDRLARLTVQEVELMYMQQYDKNRVREQ